MVPANALIGKDGMPLGEVEIPYEGSSASAIDRRLPWLSPKILIGEQLKLDDWRPPSDDILAFALARAVSSRMESWC